MSRMVFLSIILVLLLVGCTSTLSSTNTALLEIAPTRSEGVKIDDTPIGTSLNASETPTDSSSTANEPPMESSSTPMPTMDMTPEIRINRMEDHEAITLAKKTLSEELGVGVEDIEVVSVTAVTWPDASLGCPKPGMFYTQMLIPGYKVILKVDQKEYDVHVGENRGVVCNV